MTPNADRIETLVMKVQQAFLDLPELRLTLPEARELFAVDYTTCAAVLNALIASRVLARMPEGSYGRFFPHAVDHSRGTRRTAARFRSTPHSRRHAA